MSDLDADAAITGADRALACASARARNKSGLAGACVTRGNALYELARLEEALASLERAIAIDPDRVEAHTNRGSLL